MPCTSPLVDGPPTFTWRPSSRLSNRLPGGMRAGHWKVTTSCQPRVCCLSAVGHFLLEVRPSNGHLHGRRGEVPVVSARTCRQPVSFPAHHASLGGHTSPQDRSNQCRSGFLPVARWFPGKRVVYVGPMVRWAAGRPKKTRGGIWGFRELIPEPGERYSKFRFGQYTEKG